MGNTCTSLHAHGSEAAKGLPGCATDPYFQPLRLNSLLAHAIEVIATIICALAAIRHIRQWSQPGSRADQRAAAMHSLLFRLYHLFSCTVYGSD